MSARRVIPARSIDHRRIELFPYSQAEYSQAMGEDEDDGDAPLAAGLSTPEEDARRLASVDQQIYEKLQQAERDAEDIARKGYEEGFAAGEAEGRQFGDSQYRAHIQRLDGCLGDISRSLSLNAVAARDELLALALAVGEYLAGRAIAGGEATAGPMLDALLAAHPFPGAREPGAAPMTVHLNPRDLEVLAPGAQPRPGVALREDPELGRGSVRVEAAEGVLDASLERRTALLMELIQRFRDQEEP
jgi:flagellar biosynthesis/type III secretory pathway protein FliH